MGHWSPSVGLNITKNYTMQQEEVADTLQNKTLVVTTILVSTSLRTRKYG
jgi:phosphohistidine phosphatase SixA